MNETIEEFSSIPVKARRDLNRRSISTEDLRQLELAAIRRKLRNRKRLLKEAVKCLTIS